jgi:cytochrome c-type biogenesis protein CcmH
MMVAEMKTSSLLFAIALLLLAGCQDSNHLVVTAPAGPDTALARQLNDQAYSLIQKGKYADAEPFLKKAVEADVMFGPARNNLGLVYFHEQKLYPAAWEFQNAIKLMPYQPEPRNNLGLVMERAGKSAAAAEAFEAARKMEPDNPQYIGNLARVKIRGGDRSEETKALLQELVFKDSRPQWRDWAKMELLRFYARPIEPQFPTPSTQGSKP